jgi:hypothetical protein
MFFVGRCFFLDDVFFDVLTTMVFDNDGVWQRCFVFDYDALCLATMVSDNNGFFVWTTVIQGDLEGVHAQLLDERMLRREPLLQEYWRLRDRGMLEEARQVVQVSEVSY